MLNINKLFTISFFPQKVLYVKILNFDLISFIIFVRQLNELTDEQKYAYAEAKKIWLKLNRPVLFLNLDLKIWFEIISKLITNLSLKKIYLFIFCFWRLIQVIENKLKYIPKNSNIEYREKKITSLNSLNILPKLISLYKNRNRNRNINFKYFPNIIKKNKNPYGRKNLYQYNSQINRLISTINYNQEICTLNLPNYLKLFGFIERVKNNVLCYYKNKNKTQYLNLIYLLSRKISSIINTIFSPYLIKTRWSLKLVSLGQDKIRRSKFQYLIKDNLLGAYSLISLNNKKQNKLSLMNPHNLYSTKRSNRSKIYSAKPSTYTLNKKDRLKLKLEVKAKEKEQIKAILKEEAESKEIDINFSPYKSKNYNYIKGWRRNWLNKLRYLDILNKYKLDENDKLYLRILKERKHNLNKKLFQIPPVHISLETNNVSINQKDNIQSDDLESITNNRNLSIIQKKNKKNETKNRHSKFSAVGKSRDLFKNQFIQYKFNRSNANPSILNKVYTGSYLSKQKEILTSLPYLFEDLNWSEIGQFSKQYINFKTETNSGTCTYLKENLFLQSLWPEIEKVKETEIETERETQFVSKSQLNRMFNSLTLNSSTQAQTLFLSGGQNIKIPNKKILLSTKATINKKMNLSLRQIKSLIIGNLSTAMTDNGKILPSNLNINKEVEKNNNLLPLPLVDLKKIEDTDTRKDDKLRKGLGILSNVNWIDDNLSTPVLFKDLEPSLEKKDKKDKAEVSIRYLKKNNINVWVGSERIDIVSLENLFKSFFKKMYSLISLPIFEYLPNKWNIRLFYYLKLNAKTYYSSTNIINSNLRSILGINLKFHQINSIFNNSQDKVRGVEIEGGGEKTKKIIPNSRLKLPLVYKKKELHSLKLTKNKISNYPLKSQKFIDDLGLAENRNNQYRSRSMQIFSLKYFWSKIINPSLNVKKTDYYNLLDNISNLYNGNYINNMDAFLANSNPLKLYLFSKWRGESGYIEYQKKLNRNTRILQDDMTIKEAILFSNPLLTEILDSQSLIYPYNTYTGLAQINERLALFNNNKKNKLTYFNEAVKKILRSDSNKNNKLVSSLWEEALSNTFGNLNSINPWQSISPVKLNNLIKDYIINGILFKNTRLKNILNNNLSKLNLILFLVRFKEFISLSLRNRSISYRNFPISSSTSISTRTNTKTLLDLDESYKNISSHKQRINLKNQIKIFESSGINILTSDYRKIDKEIDSPNNKESKGLVSYNKFLFKKFLVFLKFIFNKDIELDLTRINNPYNETHILNQILGEEIKNKTKSFYKLIKIIRENANIKPDYMSKVELETKASTNNTNIYHLHSILADTIYKSNNFNLNKDNIILKDSEYNITSDKSLYSSFYLPISLSRKDDLTDINKEDKLKMNILHRSSSDINVNRELELGLEREVDKERDIDRHISSYNLIALDKWSNLNQLNKQKKIYKKIELDLKGIDLKNKLLNDNERDIEFDNDKNRVQDMIRDKYPISSNIRSNNIGGEVENLNDTTALALLKQQENNYINFKNVRNNFSSIKGINSEIFKDKLTNTQIDCRIRKHIIKDIFHNQDNSPTNFSTESVDYNLELNKINKIMTYKMQAPLINNQKKIISLLKADENLALKNKNLKNKGLNSILKDRNIFSYTPISTPTSAATSTLPTIPLSIKSQFKPIDIRGNFEKTGKVNLVQSNISGIKLKLGGRLEKSPIIPRKSSQEVLMGNMSRGSTSFKNMSRLTYKNKRGAYSITVTSSYLRNNKWS